MKHKRDGWSGFSRKWLAGEVAQLWWHSRRLQRHQGVIEGARHTTKCLEQVVGRMHASREGAMGLKLVVTKETLFMKRSTQFAHH
jgi:hypothetical protein